MKTYVCTKCGYTLNREVLEEDFVCPKCGGLKADFNVFEEQLAENEIDAIIDSVIEDVLDIKNTKIINEDENEKCLVFDDDNPCVYKLNEKCVNCGQCKKVCETIANLRYNLSECTKPICIGCGKCVKKCPSRALFFKEDYKEIKKIIDANEKIVIAIVEPIVSAYLLRKYDINFDKKVVDLLKRIGFDYVFNNAFARDLTIVEEVTEFADRLKSKKALPIITSSCPSWTKYAEIYHPEILENISTCKNPLVMHSSIIKKYFCDNKGFDSNKIVCVGICSCSSLEMSIKEGNSDLDYVLTIDELDKLIAEEEIDLNTLEEKEYEETLSSGSGASLLLDFSTGQSKAFIRCFYSLMTKSDLSDDLIVFKDSNISGVKESNISINDYKFRVAVVDQIKGLENLLINNSYKKYHYIEVMACNHGCVNGSQTGSVEEDYTEFYQSHLEELDKNEKIKCPLDNKELKTFYSKSVKKPMSQEALKALHTGLKDKSQLLRNK